MSTCICTPANSAKMLCFTVHITITLSCDAGPFFHSLSCQVNRISRFQLLHVDLNHCVLIFKSHWNYLAKIQQCVCSSTTFWDAAVIYSSWFQQQIHVFFSLRLQQCDQISWSVIRHVTVYSLFDWLLVIGGHVDDLVAFLPQDVQHTVVPQEVTWQKAKVMRDQKEASQLKPVLFSPCILSIWLNKTSCWFVEKTSWC